MVIVRCFEIHVENMTRKRNHPALQTYNIQHMGAEKRVKFGTVFIDGRAAIFSINFEAPHDDHIGRSV
jgi:hypothetical protein